MTELEKLQKWLKGEINNSKLLAKDAKADGLEIITENWMKKAYTLKQVLYQTYLIEDES